MPTWRAVLKQDGLSWCRALMTGTCINRPALGWSISHMFPWLWRIEWVNFRQRAEHPTKYILSAKEFNSSAITIQMIYSWRSSLLEKKAALMLTRFPFQSEYFKPDLCFSEYILDAKCSVRQIGQGQGKICLIQWWCGDVVVISAYGQTKPQTVVFLPSVQNLTDS